jgi:DNA recombination protein RmuC
MTDHLLLGILIGMASGIAALIVVSAVTLHRFEAARGDRVRVQRALADLHASWERGERGLRGDIAAARVELETATRDARDESAATARALRDEITGRLKGTGDAMARGFGELASRQERQTDLLAERLGQLTEPVLGALREHPMSTLGAMAEAQERQFSAITAELKGLGDIVDARLEDVCARLDDQVRQMQVETRERLDHLRSEALGHAKDLQNDALESLRAHAEQVRIAVDERLEGTLTRRLGENFGVVGDRLERVSDRLEQVHRGLVEVQTFATGVGNLQRALANVRLGGTKTRPDPAAGGGEAGTARRRSRRLVGDEGGKTD